MSTSEHDVDALAAKLIEAGCGPTEAVEIAKTRLANMAQIPDESD